MEATTEPLPLACGWLIEIASGNPEPDSYADTVKIIECGEPVPTGPDGEPLGRHALCSWHQDAMDSPLDDESRGW